MTRTRPESLLRGRHQTFCSRRIVRRTRPNFRRNVWNPLKDASRSPCRASPAPVPNGWRRQQPQPRSCGSTLRPAPVRRTGRKRPHRSSRGLPDWRHSRWPESPRHRSPRCRRGQTTDRLPMGTSGHGWLIRRAGDRRDATGPRTAVRHQNGPCRSRRRRRSEPMFDGIFPN